MQHSLNAAFYTVYCHHKIKNENKKYKSLSQVQYFSVTIFTNLDLMDNGKFTVISPELDLWNKWKHKMLKNGQLKYMHLFFRKSFKFNEKIANALYLLLDAFKKQLTCDFIFYQIFIPFPF